MALLFHPNILKLHCTTKVNTYQPLGYLAYSVFKVANIEYAGLSFKGNGFVEVLCTLWLEY